MALSLPVVSRLAPAHAPFAPATLSCASVLPPVLQPGCQSLAAGLAGCAVLALAARARRRGGGQVGTRSVRRRGRPKPAPDETYAKFKKHPEAAGRRAPRKEDLDGDVQSEDAPRYLHDGGRWRRKREEEELASIASVPIASGVAPVFASVAAVSNGRVVQSSSSLSPRQLGGRGRGRSRSREAEGFTTEAEAPASPQEPATLATPPARAARTALPPRAPAPKSSGSGELNVLERVRLAAEEGWNEDRWDNLGQGMWGEELERELIPRTVYRRFKAIEPPVAVKQYIEDCRLGKRKKRILKKAERRVVPFDGSDPVHNGKRYSEDDGRGSTLGRMAVAMHKGFLRHRATSFANGMLGRPGEFPLAERPEVAFIGASNVGKSSLLNAITRTQHLAEAHDENGVTRSINWYTSSRIPIDIIDLPGYGMAGGADFGELVASFIATRKALRTLYVLVDARSGLTPWDWRWLDSLGDMGPQKVFVMTKTDLVEPRSLAKVMTAVLEDMRSIPRTSDRIVGVSARMGKGLHDLRYDLCGRAVRWAAKAKKRQTQKALAERGGRYMGPARASAEAAAAYE